VIPGLSVIAVIVIVLLLALVLNWGLFRPITRIMREREAAINTATELAQAAAARAAAATAEFEQKVRDAQAGLYQEMDRERRAALDARAALVADARREVEATLAESAARLESQVADARRKLEQEADALGAAVAERMLGRKVS
jgi:F-type H+-transporting ATPase subunit b